MPNNPEMFKNKLDEITNAWEKFAPTKSFAGKTLKEFKAAVKASYDTRIEIEDLDMERDALAMRRGIADEESNELVNLVVNAVRGDPEEGEDGALYGSMGYVLKRSRKSGLTRKTQPKAPTAAE